LHSLQALHEVINILAFFQEAKGSSELG
jgi:hypothetical protein